MISLNPSSLSFNGTGSNLDQTTTVMEGGSYSGTFTATTANCSGIAEITSSTTVGQNGSYTVQPDGAGTCSFTVTDQNGMTATLSITVTTTTIIVNGTKRKSNGPAPTPAAGSAPTITPPTVRTAPVTPSAPIAPPGRGNVQRH